MKSKYGLISIAFAAASMLLAPADASAGGGSWWGRVGYGGVRVTELRACVDTFTHELRVAAKVPGAASFLRYRGIDMAATMFGNALCDDHHGDDGWYSGWAKDNGGYYGYGPYAQGLYTGYGKYDDSAIVSLDGYTTYTERAYWEPGNWFFATFDLLHLEKDVCHDGYIEDLYVDQALVYVNGRRHYLGYYDLEVCGDTWYDGWTDNFYYGWDD
jgi:hypothetical protein